MEVGQFFNLLVGEIKTNTKLRNLYKFIDSKNKFLFRKAYYCQRLDFIKRHIDKRDTLIWDCGCGYGTTGLFLSINGFQVHGNTVEYYFDHIASRYEYWKKHGDIEKFTYSYKNIFDPPQDKEIYDYVIVQDVLHHLEPNDEALKILCNSLKKGGNLIVIEENGNNIIKNLNLFLYRGNNRVIDIYDEKLDKNIKIGNENIQSLDNWRNKLSHAGLTIDENSVEYIRLFPPFMFSQKNYQKILIKEGHLWKRNRWLREYFYFGVNFTATKL